MTRQQLYYDENHMRQGSPVNSTFAETIPRLFATNNGAIAATGVVLSTGVPLQYGDVVRNISFFTATTAANAPTAGFAALYTPAGVLMAQTADFGATARAANTNYTVALATPQTAVDPGLYYVAISFTAGVVPTLWSLAVGNALIAGNLGLSARVLAQTHGAAVGAVAPGTIAAPTTVATIPYLVCT
jgi:hypothetical protein